MSGFAAIFDSAPNRELPALADDMSRAIAHRGEAKRTVDLPGHTAAVATREFAAGAYWTLVDGNDERTVVFDGFLFNEAEIRESLAAETLAEAIWRGFRRGGKDWFATLDGSFAIVIHDKARDNFYLVRDRFGHRPLLAAVVGRQVLCGSEAKALFAHPGVPRAINREVLPAALSYGLVLGPETLFEGVLKCLPGHVCEIRRRGSITHSVFYRPDLRIDENRTLADLKDALDQQLTETIGGYARRCKRLGVFLSGGLDSALLAIKLSAIEGNSGQTVSFGVSDWPADETEAAEQVAHQLDLPFTRARAEADFDALAHLRDAIRHLEAPTRYENAVALEVASRAGAGLMDGVLTGEGGGLFFGQRQHLTIRRGSLIGRVPYPLRGAVGSLCSRLPGQFMQSAAFFLRRETIEEYLRKLYLWSPELVFGESVLPPAGSGLGQAEEAYRDQDPVAAYVLINTMGFWHCWIERMEAIGAAYGIDALHPLHRNKTLELALTSPYRIKALQGGRLFKPALQQLVAERLGAAAANRPKQQLAAPVGIWLDRPSPLRDAALALRSRDSLFRSYLDSAGPDRVLEDFAANGAGDPRTRKCVFMLLSFEIWLEEFIAAVPASTAGVSPVSVPLASSSETVESL